MHRIFFLETDLAGIPFVLEIKNSLRGRLDLVRIRDIIFHDTIIAFFWGHLLRILFNKS